ncbi:hypothetical protein [uncultured Phycicoccus sp.]|uniref:hypothetical protein n=1 Tax=uncultured Phycicoccus sp. TaxID=661422 RepID=UPI002612CC9E|nr:hypothetical protein [uncultured Phycicoccus sp.]
MNIAGRVVDAAARRGLPDLVVAALERRVEGADVRLGSDVTEPDGSFQIDVDSRLGTGGPLTLVLVVSGPDAAGSDAVELHETKPRVTSPGGRERFLINIDPDLLESRGLPSSQTPFDTASIAQGLRERARALAALDEEWRTTARARVEVRRQEAEAYETTFREAFLRDVSTRPEDVAEGELLALEDDPDRSVAALAAVALERGVTRIRRPANATDGGPRRTRYFLTAEQRVLLQELLDAAPGSLTRDQLEAVLRLGEDESARTRPTRLSELDTDLERFLEETYDERCAADILAPPATPGDAGDGLDEPPEPESPEPASTGIEELVARTVGDVDAPFSELGTRPGQGDIVGNIRSFALAPGPADVPAYFDFHQLGIAFPHVWKEFLDERVEPLARAAFTRVQDLGGDPGEARLRGGMRPLAALGHEADLVASAGVEPAPRALYLQRPAGPRAHLGRDDGILVDPGLPQGPDFPPPPPVPPSPPDPPGGIGGVPLPDKTSDVGNFNEMADSTPRSLLDRLHRILRGPYSFTAFGADAKERAVNFGLTVTYRQRWEPVTYQVGELVRTITLAPGETKKYTKKMRVTRKRAEKEIEKNSSIRRDEFDTTTRAETDIIRKAQAKTNFSITAEGTYNFGIAKGDSTTSTDHDAESASDDTKKSFREAVIKASQEYRQERTLDVSSESAFETEDVEMGEISNPNTELTVTYLFFELQRRFRVTERIHAAQPVVLVAQDLPRPNEVDEAFAIRYGWVLRRALLDDRYEAALDYVCGPLAGDKVARDALYTAMLDHKAIVDRLKDDLYALKEQASEGYEALRRAVEARIKAASEEETDGFLSDLKESFLGGGQDPEAARMREEAARNHEQRAVEEVKRVTLALQREVSAYAEATEKYTRAQQAFKEWELRIADLLVHLKENICHYMQAVWAYEHPDQRFMRLRMTKVPGFRPAAAGQTYEFLGDLDLTRQTVAADGSVVERRAVEFAFTPDLEVVQDERTLAEVADLDDLLGFKGNYLIFPLRESNPLTDYLLEPYVDAGFRLIDPHDPGNISREDFARYVCHLRESLDDEGFEELRPALLERFRKLLLTDPVHGDEVVVPTGSAYIEALPGARPLLEDFKLAHRAVDVLDAREDVREAALENLRRAARILGDDLEDPDVDARYVIEGGGPVTIGTPDLPPGPPPPDDG